jgi:hypothetical protein
MYRDYAVKLTFNDGSGDYDLPYIQTVSDPIPGIKANVIRGTRADGSIVIPGGKKSVEIIAKGKLWSNDGYKELMSQQDTMRANVTTAPAILTLQYFDPTLSGGGGWVTNWSFAVRRIEDINFSSTDMRTLSLDYDVKFFITAY